MKEKTAEKIINSYAKEFDKLSNDELDLLSCFSLINKIAAKYEKEDVQTVMNITYSNGHPVCGICFVTDFHPGALLFQSDDDFAPKLRVVYPEETEEFMEQYGIFITGEYPELPEDDEKEDE